MLAVSLARQSESREDQAESISLAFQHRACREHAARRGDEIVREFSDLDVSGDRASSHKRAGLHEMIAFLKASKQIQAVYVYNLSRLGRDTLYILEIVRQLGSLKPPVKLLSASESTEDPTMLAIVGAFAERERITLSNNIANAVREQAQRGIVTQRPPIGYSRTDGILYPDANAEIVRRIFRDYTSGQTTFQIATALQRDGIPSPDGNPAWRNKAIRALLSRRTYIGEIEISETRDPVGRIRPALVTVGRHEPIIDRATWDLAQRLLASRSVVRRKDGRIEPWLSGVLTCVHCGRRVYLGVKSRSTPDRIRWYAKCSTHQLASDNRTEPTCPGQASCDVHLLEPVARWELWKRLLVITDPDAAYDAAVATTSATSDQTRASLIAQIERHKVRAANVLEDRTDRLISAEVFTEKFTAEESAITRLTLDLHILPEPPPRATYRNAYDTISGVADSVRSMSDDDLRELVLAIGATASADLASKAIVWRFAEPYDRLLA